MSQRKAEMVLELIDRATRPARRFIRLQERMGRAVGAANRMASHTARAAQRATDLYRRATAGLERAQTSLRAGIQRTNSAIARQRARLQSSAALMSTGVMGVGRAALLAGGMFAAYSGSVVLAASSFLGPARQFENFGIQLESLEGSSEKAEQAMAWIERFATRTPLELNQVVEAYQQMRTFGMDPTNGSLEALVDTMAASGKGAEHLSGLALALGKSWTTGKLQGEGMMMLMERGVPVYEILSEKIGGTAAEIQAMASAGELGRAEIQLLIDGMAERNAGASARMSTTWDGIISNLMDWWTRFQRTVMGFGVFDWMKGKLRGVLDMLNAMEASGDLEVWAKAIADNMLFALNGLWSMGQGAVALWRQIFPWIEASADALGGWRNLTLAVIAVPFRGVILGGAFALLQIAWAAITAGVALGGIGFASIAQGALRFGIVLLGLLNPINWVRGAFVALRVALIATGIGALVVGLAMAGTWIYNNWSGLTSFFTGFGSAFMAALGPARPLADGVIAGVKMIWDWISRLLGPLDANGAQWTAWGSTAGQVVGEFLALIISLPGNIVAGLQSGWASFAGWVANMWAGLSAFASLAWDGLKAVLLNYTAAGLIYQHWDGIAEFFVNLWAPLAAFATLAWEGVKNVLLNYTAAGLIYQHWEGITGFFSGLWDGVIAVFVAAWAVIDSTVVAPMRAAVEFMTNNAITRGAGAAKDWIMGNDGPEVQARAGGGSFDRGWLLTGENGPELEYRSEGGFIAHNRALQNMLATSRQIANTNARPANTGWVKGAALSAGLAASAMALPAAAEMSASEDAEAPSAVQYLKGGNGGSVSLSPTTSITIQGNITPDAMSNLQALLDERDERLVEMLEQAERSLNRRSHG